MTNINVRIGSEDSFEKAPENLRNVSFGLALSGGGYRAAAFHLGTLAYLDRIKLLPHLKRLSTVSGGTFTGMKYILSLVERVSFIDFFQGFYLFLSEQDLLKDGLADLSNGSVRVPSGKRKLILSMANVYANSFLKSPNGSPYKLGTIIDSDISVKEITFNTTEFRTGLAFRFQKSDTSQARIGNGKIYISKESAKDIRLADIVAASSCFPGGFEPIEFPQDFAWTHNKVPKEVKADITKDNQFKSLALMDGGIYDNQGIDSLLLPDSRKNSEPLDLVIISDVDPVQDELFPYPQNNQPSSKLTLGQVDLFIRLFLFVCVLTILSVGYKLWQEIKLGTFVFWQGFFSALMPLILVLGVVLSIWWGREIIRKQILPRIPQVEMDGWKYLKTLTVNELFYLLELRLKSLLALTSSIFMDRIKSLIFARTYGDVNYKDKRISNRIDRLVNRELELPGITPLSSGLKNVIKRATKMPTTLWFDCSQQLIDVTVAGQATICFNLLQHIVRRYGKVFETYPTDVKELWRELNKDWDSLNSEPNCLLQELLPVQNLSYEKKRSLDNEV